MPGCKPLCFECLSFISGLGLGHTPATLFDHPRIANKPHQSHFGFSFRKDAGS